MASVDKVAAPAKPSHASRKTDRARAPDPLALLEADHETVKALFTQYKKLCKNDAEGSDKADVAAQIEEAISPPLRDGVADNNARVKVLGEYINLLKEYSNAVPHHRR